MDGRIIKGIAGFYYVYVEGLGVYECHARGILRRGSYRPLPGDRVSIEVLDENEKTGSLLEIYERKNDCIRPQVANVDQAIIIFAYEKPNPNFILLDTFLVMLEKQNISDLIICFNKLDRCDKEKRAEILDNYSKSGHKVFEISAETGEGVDTLLECLKGRVTVLAGPSGVGKSTLINRLHPVAQAKTGEISKKSERGKHTTRHSELFYLGDDTYIMDTPGFTALELTENTESIELKDYYREFFDYEGLCRFEPCSHTHEPGCKVKEALVAGDIKKLRYDNYCSLYKQLKDRRRF